MLVFVLRNWHANNSANVENFFSLTVTLPHEWQAAGQSVILSVCSTLWSRLIYSKWKITMKLAEHVHASKMKIPFGFNDWYRLLTDTMLRNKLCTSHTGSEYSSLLHFYRTGSPNVQRNCQTQCNRFSLLNLFSDFCFVLFFLSEYWLS